ncbi:unnamed protein product [Paramecium sonneborni]|uniref:Rab-GAP TBC domain-containing protein n=1 Tax=Paramecium sonneborni TaxID=65129 RepID=A0A8S1LEA0_9CILI|nr:unnamed protein product [Paramecium sonneborni]
MLSQEIDIEILSKNLTGISNDNQQLIKDVQNILRSEIVDEEGLIKLCQQGFTNQTSRLRGIVWRLLLGYFPLNRKYWSQVIIKNRDNYNNIKIENIKKAPAQKKNDHPLSRNTDSEWNNHFQDQQLWSKIQKDVIRTRVKELRKEEDREMLTRILFLCCKLNKMDYVQGMNEFAALILYMCMRDPNEKLQNESDAFYCFMILMTSLKDNFQLQKEKVRAFQDLLKKVDWKLHDHLVNQKMDFSILYVKWFMILFAQDFHIDDSLRIWDCLLCQKNNREEFTYYLSISFLIQLREFLIAGDFGQILLILQNLEKQDINLSEVIQRAHLLQKEQKKC